MIRSEPGTIVLVKFPFTDFSSTKKRPAVVISPILYGARYGDTVVVPLTSSPAIPTIALLTFLTSAISSACAIAFSHVFITVRMFVL